MSKIGLEIGVYPLVLAPKAPVPFPVHEKKSA
jgi:hypothetical protein